MKSHKEAQKAQTELAFRVQALACLRNATSLKAELRTRNKFLVLFVPLGGDN